MWEPARRASSINIGELARMAGSYWRQSGRPSRAAGRPHGGLLLVPIGETFTDCGTPA